MLFWYLGFLIGRERLSKVLRQLDLKKVLDVSIEEGCSFSLVVVPLIKLQIFQLNNKHKTCLFIIIFKELLLGTYWCQHFSALVCADDFSFPGAVYVFAFWLAILHSWKIIHLSLRVTCFLHLCTCGLFPSASHIDSGISFPVIVLNEYCIPVSACWIIVDFWIFESLNAHITNFPL